MVARGGASRRQCNPWYAIRTTSPGGATETMTLPRFGKIVPLQGDVLELAGYVLSRSRKSMWCRNRMRSESKSCAVAGPR